MGPKPAFAAKYVFGPFEFEAGSGELRKYGTRIRLPGKPLQILTLLLDRPGEVVSREELQRRLWEGTTFVDFEQGINSAVNKLRQALGDSPDQPRYVETVPGKGYRFVAPLHNPTARTVLEIAAPPVAAEAKPVQRWIPWAVAGALAAAGAGYWAGGAARPVAAAPPAMQYTIAPPAGYAIEGAATRQSLALSPDGTRLAYSAVEGSGAFQLFLRDLSSRESIPIPGTRGANTLFWPGNSDALYVSFQGKIRRIPLRGEGFVAVADAPPFTLTGLLQSPERLLLDTSRGSYTVSPSGGTPAEIGSFVHWPQALPGTSELLYTAWDPATKRYRAVIGSPDQPASTRLSLLSDSRIQFAPSTQTPGTSFLLYVSGGNLVAHPFDLSNRRLTGDAVAIARQVTSFQPLATADFTVSARGTLVYQEFVARSQLRWVDRAGRPIAKTGPGNVSLKSASLSPDQRYIATSIYDVERGGQNLWIVDATTGTAKQLTDAAGIRDSAVWSPSGDRLAYLHGAGGRSPKIAIRGVGENEKEVIETEGGFQNPTDWSPDGRFLAFTNNGSARLASEVQGDVFLMDLERNRKITPLLHSTFHEGSAAFSPDGKWVAFLSAESGAAELYVQAFRGGDSPAVTGERFRISRAGAQLLRWRRDGRELFYLGYDGRVYAVPVQVGGTPRFGAAERLFEIPAEARAAIHAELGFDVSADGRRFVIPTVSDAAAPVLVVVQNWESLLPGKGRP